MQIHASCAARDSAAVLVTGPPGSGKSDLVLRLFDLGFILVADDQVMIDEGIATAPERLKGLLEVRGVGIVRVDHLPAAELRLLVRLTPGCIPERLPAFRSQVTPDQIWGLPAIEIDPWHASAAQRVAMALSCATGEVPQLAGAFVA